MSKQKLKVDFESLIMALESGRDFAEHYFDSESGEVIIVSDCCDDEEEQRQRIEDEPDRFLEIPQIQSSKSFRIMEDFMELVEDPAAKKSLERALRGRKPFRAFKDELTAYPELRKEWFAFHEKRMTEFARHWLKENDIDTE